MCSNFANKSRNNNNNNNSNNTKQRNLQLFRSLGLESRCWRWLHSFHTSWTDTTTECTAFWRRRTRAADSTRPTHGSPCLRRSVGSAVGRLLTSRPRLSSVRKENHEYSLTCVSVFLLLLNKIPDCEEWQRSWSADRSPGPTSWACCRASRSPGEYSLFNLGFACHYFVSLSTTNSMRCCLPALTAIEVTTSSWPSMVSLLSSASSCHILTVLSREALSTCRVRSQ